MSLQSKSCVGHFASRSIINKEYICVPQLIFRSWSEEVCSWMSCEWKSYIKMSKDCQQTVFPPLDGSKPKANMLSYYLHNFFLCSSVTEVHNKNTLDTSALFIKIFIPVSACGQEGGQGECTQPVAETQKLHTEANSQHSPPPSKCSVVDLIESGLAPNWGFHSAAKLTLANRTTSS